MPERNRCLCHDEKPIARDLERGSEEIVSLKAGWTSDPCAVAHRLRDPLQSAMVSAHLIGSTCVPRDRELVDLLKHALQRLSEGIEMVLASGGE